MWTELITIVAESFKNIEMVDLLEALSAEFFSASSVYNFTKVGEIVEKVIK